MVNCQRCGQVLLAEGTYCSTCNHEMEQQFRVVREFIRNHQGVNLFEITSGTGVAIPVVLQMIKEGRLKIN
ncbi:MAG: hypothetical protein M0Z31_04865 [Clostridia bacterium]|nr:hypothetical protein [Clostridia bacterium]